MAEEESIAVFCPRPRSQPRLRTRLILMTVALGMILLALPSLSTPAAAANEPKSWARISLEGVSPALPNPDNSKQKVTLTGRITNSSAAELSNLQVAYWRSLDPIETARGMNRALLSAADDPLGARVAGGELFVNVPSEADRTLAPGESTTFKISARLSQLQFPDINGVYLVGVHLRGRTDPFGPDVTLGRARAFLPVVADPPPQQVRQTSIVVLASRPSQIRAGVFVDDHLADEFADRGRLTQMLAIAGGDKRTFAIDPALVEAAQAMVTSYQIQHSDGTLETKSGSAAARAWLSRLASLIQTGDGFQLPYGNPDIAALVHHNRMPLLAAAVKRGAVVPTTAQLPLLMLPAAGAADQATVVAAAAARPAAIVLANDAVRISGSGTGRAITESTVLRGPAGTPLIRFTAGSTGGGPGPEPRNTPVKVRQRMLSDTWIAARAATVKAPASRVRVITTPAQSAGDAGVAAPWISPATLSTLLDQKPVAWRGSYHYSSTAQAAELTDSQLATTTKIEAQFTELADLLVRPADAATAASIVVPQTVSAAWRGRYTQFRHYTNLVRNSLDQTLHDDVSLTVYPKVSTTGRSGGFPITIHNNLPAGDKLAPGAPEGTNAVKVAVVLESAANQRLTVTLAEDTPKPIQVAAGQSVTVDAKVHAEANGTVQVRALLQTTTGRLVGEPVTTQVTTTQAGTAGWLIAIIAGIVLIGTTALRIRQVSRERAAADQEPQPIQVSRPPDDQGTW